MENCKSVENKELSKRYFKVKVIGPMGHVPVFICEAHDKREAKVLAEKAYEYDINKEYQLTDPEEISYERYIGIRSSEKGADQYSN